MNKLEELTGVPCKTDSTVYIKDSKDIKDNTPASPSVCSTSSEKKKRRFLLSQKDLVFSEKEDVVPVAVSEKEIVLARPPQLVNERCQQAAFSLFRNKSRYGNKTYSLNVQFKIDDEFVNFTTSLSNSLGVFHRPNLHVSEEDKTEVDAQALDTREDICKRYNLFKKNVYLGKIKQQAKQYIKGKKQPKPIIPKTLVLVWYDKTEEVWRCTVRYEDAVWIDVVLDTEPQSKREKNSNLIYKTVWFPEMQFSKCEEYVPEWK